MLREPRFWITVLIVAGCVALAALGHLRGETVAGIFTGILLRFGATATKEVQR